MAFFKNKRRRARIEELRQLEASISQQELLSTGGAKGLLIVRLEAGMETWAAFRDEPPQYDAIKRIVRDAKAIVPFISWAEAVALSRKLGVELHELAIETRPAID